MGQSFLAVVLASALVACPKKKTDAADAAADAEVAVVDAAAPAAEGTNFGEIARFGDETKIDHQTAKLEMPFTIVRKSPPNGDHVTTLAKGIEVVKIAQQKEQVLVTFANPKKPDERLMGWVTVASFTAPPPYHGPGACKFDKDCKSPAQCGHTPDGFRCVIKCDDTATGACPKEMLCTGNAAIEAGVIRYCLAAPKDAGARDSGAKADGGK